MRLLWVFECVYGSQRERETQGVTVGGCSQLGVRIGGFGREKDAHYCAGMSLGVYRMQGYL